MITPDQELAIVNRIRKENPHGVVSGDTFLDLALRHNFNAYDHFDVEGDSYSFQAWVDEYEAERYVELTKKLGALGTNTVELGVEPPEEFCLSHSVATNGDILLLSGKARSFAAVSMCSVITPTTADVDFSFMIREREMALKPNPLESEDHDIHYPITRHPCYSCKQPGCLLYSCHRMVVMGVFYLFDD